MSKAMQISAERWGWMARYGVVLVLAIALAAALGEMTLFKTTRIGRSGVNAAHLVQFLGYGAALLVFWLLARRAAALLDASDPRCSVVKSIALPAATLVVTACGQAVLLLLIGPWLGRSGHQVYDWIAVVAIIAAAAWLLGALFTGSSSLARE